MPLTPFQKLVVQFLLFVMEDYLCHKYHGDVEANPQVVAAKVLRDKLDVSMRTGRVLG